MTIPAETPDLKQPPRPSRRYFQIALLVTLFGLLLQAPCLTFQKVIDDNDLIYSVEQRGCGAHPTDCFQNPVFLMYYRPLFTATFSVGDNLHAAAADAANNLLQRWHIRLPGGYRFQAHDTFWYHLENLALHAAVCGLAFWFFYLLFQRERPALLAGIILSLHPLQVTVTTFIGGRPDSMALFFLLLFSIGAWNATQSTVLPRSGLRRSAWLLLSILAYTCAVFTKEQCISMLLLLPLLLWRRGHVFPLKNVPWLALYLVPIGLYIRAAKKIIPFVQIPSNHGVGVTHYLGWSGPLHLEMIVRTLWYFQHLLVFPTAGPIHQSTLGPWDVPQPEVVIAGTLLTIAWLAMLWRFRSNPTYRFCALWTTLTLLPCINLIPIPSQFASCYRAVIPLLGFAGLLGMGLDKMLEWWQARMQRSDYTTYEANSGRTLARWQSGLVLRRRALGWMVVAVIGAFYTWETMTDVWNWQNNHVLMLAEGYGDPNFVPIYAGLGWEDDMRADWKQSEHDYDTLLTRILPTVQPGQTFAQAVDSAACQRNLWSQAGLRYHPHEYIGTMLPHRGWARQQLGHFTAACADYRLTLEIRPDDDNTRANLRNCLMANGQVDEAISLYRNASEVLPRSQNDPDRTTSQGR